MTSHRRFPLPHLGASKWSHRAEPRTIRARCKRSKGSHPPHPRL
ncbi:hypothetical protein BDA96_10G185500 [Sorghum bicolor]|uniref:Uncharacterized protein n=1 Tax=Sorghum bicolor TaxID=4558 RepID=A0A921Q503_SORBI|nr:hypothetical protein BDA96_10G185500 [Sorghum bicolor]